MSASTVLKSLSFSFALMACFLGSYCPAAVFDSFDPSVHSRFLANGDVNPAFFVPESSITGVAGDPSDPDNRAVLITPFHYLTAGHVSEFSPMFRGSDGVLRTYTGTTFVDLTTNAGTVTGGSDLRLVRLDAPIPAAHGVTPLALLDGNPSDIIGQELTVFTAGNLAGRNVIDNIVISSFAGGTSPTFAVQYGFDTATNGGTGGLGADEVGLTGGDSGHAALVQIGDEFAVVGTHFGIDISMGQVPSAGDQYNSFTSLVTPYLDEIDSITQADGFSIRTLSVSAVPEPAHWIFVLGIGLALVTFRKRRATAHASV